MKASEMWSVLELTTSGNKRSHIKACQVMKSIVPGCWQENDPLEGGEPSSLSHTAHHTEKKRGEASVFDGQVTRDCYRYWSGD